MASAAARKATKERLTKEAESAVHKAAIAKERALMQIQKLFGETKERRGSTSSPGARRQSMVTLDMDALRNPDAHRAPGLEGLLTDPPAKMVIGQEKTYEGRSLCCFLPAMWPRRPTIFMVESKAVSYTHLTLPTICSV